MSELNIESTNTTSQKGKRFLFYIVGIITTCLFVCLALSFTVNFIDNKPEYIEVEIDLPGEHDWRYTEKTVLETALGGTAKYYIRRSETTVYKDFPDNFDTTDSVIAYIENQLKNNGWKRVNSFGDFRCNFFMPESKFLKWENTYVLYKLQDWVPLQRGTPTLCLAVWPIENHDGFYVVVMTEKPSFWTEWHYFWEPDVIE